VKLLTTAYHLSAAFKCLREVGPLRKQKELKVGGGGAKTAFFPDLMDADVKLTNRIKSPVPCFPTGTFSLQLSSRVTHGRC
jgi:hypothetical protein